MWEKVNNLCASFRALFEVGKEEHSKCPRCKGTGLMVIVRPLSHQEHVHMSNEPCWFCEGVGVLPIIGLKGFLLARASSQINTCDFKLHKFSPGWLEPSLSNHAGSCCKFITYRPAEQISNFTFHSAETPPWFAKHRKEVESSNSGLLANHALSVTLDGLSNSASQLKDEISFPSRQVSVAPCSGIPFKPQNAISSFTRQQTLDISKPSTGFQPKSRLASSPVVECSCKSSQSNKGKKLGQGDKEFDTSKHPGSSPSFGGTPSPDVSLNVSHVEVAIQEKRPCRLQSSSCKDSFLSTSETRASIHLGMALPAIRSIKIHRNARRGRNRIREKAQKEAKENATRMLKALIPREVNSSITSPNEIPEGAWLLASTKDGEAVERDGKNEKKEGLFFFRFQHSQQTMETWLDNFRMKNFNFQLIKDRGSSFTKATGIL